MAVKNFQVQNPSERVVECRCLLLLCFREEYLFIKNITKTLIFLVRPSFSKAQCHLTLLFFPPQKLTS